MEPHTQPRPSGASSWGAPKPSHVCLNGAAKDDSAAPHSRASPCPGPPSRAFGESRATSSATCLPRHPLNSSTFYPLARPQRSDSPARIRSTPQCWAGPGPVVFIPNLLGAARTLGAIGVSGVALLRFALLPCPVTLSAGHPNEARDATPGLLLACTPAQPPPPPPHPQRTRLPWSVWIGNTRWGSHCSNCFQPAVPQQDEGNGSSLLQAGGLPALFLSQTDPNI